MEEQKELIATVEELEHLLPRLKSYEKEFQIANEKEAVQFAHYFFEKAILVHKQLAQKELRTYPELFRLFSRLKKLDIHPFDQSVRTTGDSTWTLNPSWTLIIETPAGPFGVYTLGVVIVGEFKKILKAVR